MCNAFNKPDNRSTHNITNELNYSERNEMKLKMILCCPSIVSLVNFHLYCLSPFALLLMPCACLLPIIH